MFCKERNSQNYDSVEQTSRCLTVGRDLTNDSCSSAIDTGKEYDQIQPRYSQFVSHFTNTRKVIARSQTQSVQNQQRKETLNPKILA